MSSTNTDVRRRTHRRLSRFIAALATVAALALLLPPAASASVRAASPATGSPSTPASAGGGTATRGSQGSTAWGPAVDKVIGASRSGDYAVFDADNTLWQNDLTEALLPWMEQKGEITFDGLDPSLKLLPINAGESLYGYYLRLCDTESIDVCYYWIAAAFSNIPISELRAETKAMMADGRPIPVTYLENGKIVQSTVTPPKPYAAQIQLINRLRAKGVHVYVVTAANQEVARILLSDPAFGYNFPAADILGVGFVLKDPVTGQRTTARQQIDAGHFFDSSYSQEQYDRSVITPLLTEATWYEGKTEAIRKHISKYRDPILVAGDARSDWSMLFEVNTSNPCSGVRLWVDKGSPGVTKLVAEQKDRAAEQRSLRMPVDADRGWVVRLPADLSPAA